MATIVPSTNANLGMPIGLDNLGSQELLSLSPTLSTGAAVQLGFSLQHYGGLGPWMGTEIWMKNVPIALNPGGVAGTQFGGIKLGTFPRGLIQIHSSMAWVQQTTVSSQGLGTGIIASQTMNFGLGQVTAAADTLVTTQMNLLPVTGAPPTLTTSATIDVAGTAVKGNSVAATQTPLDGSTTAIPIFFNVAIAADAGLTAGTQANILISALININWAWGGGFQYRPF